MSKQDTIEEANRRIKAAETCTHHICKEVRNRLVCTNCGTSIPNPNAPTNAPKDPTPQTQTLRSLLNSLFDYARTYKPGDELASPHTIQQTIEAINATMIPRTEAQPLEDLFDEYYDGKNFIIIPADHNIADQILGFMIPRTEHERVVKIAKKALADVERDGWTISVHTNCLAVLKSLVNLERTS